MYAIYPKVTLVFIKESIIANKPKKDINNITEHMPSTQKKAEKQEKGARKRWKK